MKSTYKTSKTIGLGFLFIGAIGWGLAIYSSPVGFKTDTVVLILAAILIYIFFDLMWGTHVDIQNNVVTRTDNFIMKKRIAISNIDFIRYQPTYGVGKEARSLYLFSRNQESAVFTMTSLWFGEKNLGRFVNELVKINPQISFDSEAQALIEKYQY